MNACDRTSKMKDFIIIIIIIIFLLFIINIIYFGKYQGILHVLGFNLVHCYLFISLSIDLCK